MSSGTDRSGHPALQAAARLPAYIVLSLLIVAVTAGGLLAARGQRAETVPVAAADADPSPLPTPVPVESATPLPTPIPLGQTVIVDTAVAFWVAFIPEELADEYRHAILAAGGIPALRPSRTAHGGDAQSGDAPSGDSAGGTSTGATAAPAATPVPVVPSLGGGVAATTPAPLPAPPLPSDPVLPVPLPSVPLPVPTPTLPPLLP